MEPKWKAQAFIFLCRFDVVYYVCLWYIVIITNIVLLGVFMDIKTILKDSNFIDFIGNASKMNIDIFETIEENKAFGVKRSKFRINYDKVIQNSNIYGDCFNHYKKAMQNLTDLYSNYTTEFATIDEFAVDVFDKLKNYLVNSNVLPSSNNSQKRVLTPTDAATYEAKRLSYIKSIISHGTQLNNMAAIKVLETAPVENIANFIDATESTIDQVITDLGENVSDQALRDVLLHEYLVSYLPESYIQGDNLTTQKIEINKTRFSGQDPKYTSSPEQLKALAFLENFILANNLGLTAQGVAFDGFRFFNTTTGQTIHANTQNLHKSKLSTADRYLQSNFVLNEDFAKALLVLPKKFVKTRGKNCIKTTSVVDGDTIESTKVLYRKKFVTKNIKRDVCFNLNLELGSFCKVKEFNKDKGTYTFMLYYYPDQEGEQPIQLFRIDKVEDMFKGAPASHNLRGKEKIETTLHAHSYNLIDAVLKNYTKEESLGKMDLSHVFSSANAFDSKLIEEYFDCFCGIHGLHLRKVNQAQYASLFAKYQPQGPELQ